MAEIMEGLRMRESEHYTITLMRGHRIDVEDKTTGTVYGILLFDQDLIYDENEVEDVAPVNGVDHPVREIRRSFSTERHFMNVIRTRVLNIQNAGIMQEDFTLTIGELQPEQRQILHMSVTPELFELFEDFNEEPQPQDGGQRQRRTRKRKTHKRKTQKRKTQKHRRRH
jgi:hypothetical protein